ncbi:MAG: hypothetical protein CVU22_20865 [Betaproteobacteria bacterium HGW-Betaproteobacteria-16]|nr:MAG: hypothetical protein CVU22_20865 [Betaproteobacteria bacterium HGW-Betaproteobacteria-16]
MKFAILTLLLIYSTITHSTEVQIKGTDIKFTAPTEFSALSQDVLDRKWPKINRPAWAVGNKNAKTTIAYDVKENDISQHSLNDLIPVSEQALDRSIPRIEWVNRKVISLAGRKWIFLEMKSAAIDADIHNILLLSSYKNKMIMFNFNSTIDEMPKYKQILLDSIQSIAEK